MGQNLNNESIASSNASAYFTIHQGRLRVAFIPLICLNFVSSLTAVSWNLLIIDALRRNRSLRSPSKALLCSLALSDFMIGLIVQPLYVATEIAAMKQDLDTFNKLINPTYFLLTASILLVVSGFTKTTIAVDRFLALRLRQRYRVVVTLRRVQALLVSFWVCGVLMAALFWWEMRYFGIILSLIIFACILISSFTFIRVYWKMRQIQVHNQNLNQQISNAFNLVRYKKSVESMLYVHILFVISFLPEIVTLCAAAIVGWEEPSGTLFVMQGVSLTVLFINSSLNPLMYCWRIREVRHSVRQSLSSVLQICSWHSQVNTAAQD